VGRRWRWALAAVALLAVAALVAAGVALPRLVDTARVRSLIASAASQALGRPVSVRSVEMAIVPLPSVVLRDVEVGDHPSYGAEPLARLAEVRVRLRLWPLLLLRVELGDVLLVRPRISLVADAAGRWNAGAVGLPGAEPRRAPRGRGGGGGSAPAGAVLASRIRIESGLVTIERRHAGGVTRHRIEGVDLTATPAAVGRLALEARARLSPGDVELGLVEGALDVVAGRALADTPVAARLTVRARALGSLLAAGAAHDPGVAGSVEGSFTIGGTVGRPSAVGTVTVSEAALVRTEPRCPEPRRRVLALGPASASARLDDGRLTADPVSIAVAGGEIRASVGADLGRGSIEVTELGARGVAVERLLVDFLCQRYAVTGPLALRGNLEAQAADPLGTMGGSGQVRIGPGTIAGAQAIALVHAVGRLGGELSSLLRAPAGGGAPIGYDAITATYRIDGGVVFTNDLELRTAGLRVSAAGTYTLASGALDLHTEVRQGRAELRARVTGSASSPTIRLVGGPVPGPARAGKAGTGRGFEKLLERFR
jgi:uncharacterized protein involved in outer membrane biogenesis